MLLKSIKIENTFHKYLISYIVVFLLPFVVLSILVFNYLFDILQDEVILNNYNTLQSSKISIEKQIERLEDIGEQIYSTHNFESFHFEDHPYLGIEVIDTLNNYITFNSFYEDIILYFPGDDYLYSARSSIEIKRFINDYYDYENWEEEDFYQTINTAVTPLVRPAENVLKQGRTNERIVTFIYPLTYNGLTPNRVLLFLIPENSLNMFSEDSLNVYHSNSIIIDDQGQYISILKNEAYLYTDDFKEMYASLQEESSQEESNKIISLDGEKYILTYMPSEKYDWAYLTLTPQKEVLKQVATTRGVFVLFLFLLLVAGGVIIYFLMTTNYNPIKKLMQYSEKIFANKNMPTNDIEIVKQALDYLNTANKDMRNRLNDSVQATREYLLIQLLEGKFVSVDTFNQQAEPFGMHFTKSIFRVVIIHIKNTDIPNLEMANLLEASLSKDVEGYTTIYAEKTCYVLIVAYNDENKFLDEAIPDLQAEIKKRSRLNATIGIGEACKEIGKIPNSYMEALNAIDYRFIKGHGQIIYFKEISNISSLVDLSLYRVPEHLKTLIKQGDIDRIENILINISSYLKQDTTSIFTARMVCSDIISTIVQSLNELSIDYNIPKSAYPDVLALSTFQTVDEFVEIVRNAIQNICRLLLQVMEEEGTSLAEQMSTYIKENYTEFDFSIQKMAEHFNMSQSNLSRYFKEHTNINILDYITHLKIEKTKTFLTETNMSINEIASQLGYYNVTSFIRRFKQIVGITPGEYRKQNTVSNKK